MKPSNELKDIMVRLYESQSYRDIKSIDNLLSRQKGVMALDADPNEWWEGYDIIYGVLKLHLQEEGSITVRPGDLNAFVEGTAGWVADNPIVVLPTGQEIPIRVTSVFRQEEGTWKIVRHHVSINPPNPNAFGDEYITI